MSDVEQESQKKPEKDIDNETKEKKENDTFASERFAASASVKQMYAEKWIDISLDTDRQLLTLSTAAIGLLATFITNKGVESIFQLLLLVFSVIAFAAVIAMLLYIFKLNRNYLMVQSNGLTPDESLMLFLDKSVRILFCTGIFCTSIYTLTFAVHEVENKLSKKEDVVNGPKGNGSSEKPSRGENSSSDGQRSGSGTNHREPGGDEKPSSNNSSDANIAASERTSSTK